MGVGRIFPGGGHEEIFQNFSRGAKSGEIFLSHSKLRKQPFLLTISKSKGSFGRPFPTPIFKTGTSVELVLKS